MTTPMTGPDGDPLTRFEEAFRRLAERPLATPPELAARRLAARLEGRRRQAWKPLRLAFGLTAAVLLVAIALWLRPDGRTVAPAAAGASPPPLGDGVVLLWIDRDTPLYMTFTPPPSEKGAS